MYFIGLSFLDLSKPLSRRFRPLLSRLISACTNVEFVHNPEVATFSMKFVENLLLFSVLCNIEVSIVHAVIVLHPCLGDLHRDVEAYDNTLASSSTWSNP